MSIRSDVTIDWSVSPRIITIASPSTEITIQDLLDTLRYLEATPTAMDDKPIIDAAGKESLGGGVYVGLTATLQNALIAFEARSGPLYTQCNVSGGNVVSLESDLVTYFVTPIHPTAFTQVVVTASSSATQTEQDDIRYSSYGGGVSIDINNNTGKAIPGTEYPAGNKEWPCDNINDAVIIAHEKGFDTLFIIGNATLGIGVDVTGFTIIGQNAVRTMLTLLPEAVVDSVEIFDCRVTGTLDGDVIVKDSVIDGLNYVTGFIHHCAITSKIVVANDGATIMIMDSYSMSGSYAEVDMGGSGQSLFLSGVKGSWKISNFGVGSFASLELDPASVILDDLTVNGGFIRSMGVGWLEDNNSDHISSGVWNGVTIENECVCTHSISDRVLDTSLIDHQEHSTLGGVTVRNAYNGIIEMDINGEAGTEFPTGMQHHPVNNIPDALALLDRYHISVIKINSSIDIPINSTLNGITFISGATIDRTITIPATCSTDGTIFKGVKLNGVLDGRVYIEECVIQNVSGFRGDMYRSYISGGLLMSGDTGIHSHINYCSAEGDSMNMPYIDINGSRLHILDWIGWVELRNKTSDDLLGISSNGGIFLISDTCVAGDIIITGVGEVTDNSGALCGVDSTRLINNDNTTIAVWDSVQGQQSLNDVEFVKNIEGGRWIIDSALNQMVFYAEDNISEVARFDLLDKDGLPTSENVFERVKI